MREKCTDVFLFLLFSCAGFNYSLMWVSNGVYIGEVVNRGNSFFLSKQKQLM